MKVKSPLLSFSASGSLANLITFLNIRGSTYAKTKQGKIGATSAAQLEQRAKFKAACVASHLLTDEEKLYYHNLDIRSASCSWFNNFMSTVLLEEEAPPEAMIESIQHFTFLITGSEVFHTIEINEVDLNCSIMICSGHLSNSEYSTRSFAIYEFIDSTHIRAARRLYSGDDYCLYDVHVVEFKSSIIQSLQYLTNLIVTDELDVTTEINDVVLNKSIILHYGEYSFSNALYRSVLVSHRFFDSTHVITNRGYHVGDVGFAFTVLEFK